MKNRANPSLEFIGYSLIRIVDESIPLITIGCVISTMCQVHLQYQLLNPTTQLALFAVCHENCLDVDHVTWKIYQRGNEENSSWILFDQLVTYENRWLFGRHTTNFTATNQLFLNNPQISFWRFEVVYQFLSSSSSSAMHFLIDSPPTNGSCTISPSNGTITTLVNISCSNWFDRNGIKDYSLFCMFFFLFVNSMKTRLMKF